MKSDKKIIRREPKTSAAKTAADSAFKKQIGSSTSKKSKIISPTNMMPLFLEESERNRENHLEKQNDEKMQSNKLSSENESQLAVFAQSNKKNIKHSFDNTALKEIQVPHLPKSYLLGMQGLQQAVRQRQNQIKRLEKKNIQLSEQNKQLQQQVSNGLQDKKDMESKISELGSHNKLLRQSLLQQKNQLIQSEKKCSEIQTLMKLSKDTKNSEYTAILNENKKLTQHNIKMLEENKLFKEKYENQQSIIKKYEAQLKNKQVETQILRSQLVKIEKDMKMAHGQILVLKEQTAILANKCTIYQSEAVKAKQFEKTSAKQNHKLMGNDQHEDQRQRYPRQAILRRRQKSVSRLSNLSQSPYTMVEKLTNRTNLEKKPEIISQNRQLLRLQKELVGLYYQIQLIEQKMGRERDVEKKQQLQKEYTGLRRKHQVKQIQIKQIKTILGYHLI